MSERDDEVHIDIDPMLFMQAVVDDQLVLIDSIKAAGEGFGGMPGLGSLADGVVEVGREKVAEAQEHLDQLIAEDPTWSSSEECRMAFDGTDTDGTEWYQCMTHFRMVLGDAYVCEGYEAPPYTGGH
jgi:hypothetical protein